MRRTILFLTCFLLSMSIGVQAQFPPRMQPAKDFKGTTLTRTVSDDGRAKLTVYIPEKTNGMAVMCCPGGAYMFLSPGEGHPWANLFGENGFVYAVLEYRLPRGNRSLPLSDAENAMKMMRDSAAVWGFNPGKIGIMGFSAGGHLASSTATHAPEASRPNFQILIYPVITLGEGTENMTFNNFLGDDKTNADVINDYSNQLAVNENTPPAVIFFASDDDLVNPVANGIAYYTAMRKNGRDCSLYIHPNGGHGFCLNPSNPATALVKEEMFTWIKFIGEKLEK